MQLRELEPEFEKRGVAVRFIVIGDDAKVSSFCGQHGMADRCLADPDKSTYKAMGFGQYNFLNIFGDKDLGRRHRENRRAGFRQNWGATRIADGTQLPGAAIIDREGNVVWKYAGKHPGDLPPMRDMLEKCSF